MCSSAGLYITWIFIEKGKALNMYNDLDPVLHSPLRLAIISILVGVKKAEFNYLKEETETSSGNLSFQLSKLQEAGYIKVLKGYKKKYPLTTLVVTAKGKKALEDYVKMMKIYLKL